MKSLNKITLIGNVGSKTELKHSGDLKIINLSIATSEKKKNGQEETFWHRLVAFGSTAEAIDKYVEKGHRIYVEGKLTYGKFVNKEAIEVKTSDIIVNNLIMLSSKSESIKNDKAYDSFKTGIEESKLITNDFEDLPF